MIAGVVLIVVGAVLALPQIVTPAPSLPLFWGGLIVAVFGAVLATERRQT